MGTNEKKKGAGKRSREERAALALEIVEDLARSFRDPDEEINGGDLVNWVGGRLEADGFLAEARS